MAEEIRPTDPMLPRAQEPQQRQSMLGNILAILGFIILIVIVVWGLIHLVSLSSGWFSGGGEKNEIRVTAPAGASSGTSFNINWSYTPTTRGMYAVMFPCRSGLRMATPVGVPAREGAQIPIGEIPCGATYAVGATTTTMTLLPLLAASSSVPVQLTVLYIPSATTSKVAKGTATVTIAPSSAQPERATSTPPVQVDGEPAPRPQGGLPNIVVRVVSLTTDPSGMTVVTFDIENTGGSPTGSYRFEAQLPTFSTYTYYSSMQSSLGPGDHVLNTLTFSQTVPGLFQVIADTGNAVRESNEADNVAQQTTNLPYGSYQYGY